MTVFKANLAFLSILVISGCLYLLGWLVFSPLTAEGWTTGLRPALFHSAIKPELRIFSEPAYASIFGVAHNSGDSLQATLEALIYGADAIEIDVVEIDGVLYSAHSSPLPFVGREWFRGPRLDTIWTASFGAEAVVLDLNESSPAFVSIFSKILVTRAPYRKIVVAGSDPGVLAQPAPVCPICGMTGHAPGRTFGPTGSASRAFLVESMVCKHSTLDGFFADQYRANRVGPTGMRTHP